MYKITGVCIFDVVHFLHSPSSSEQFVLASWSVSFYLNIVIIFILSLLVAIILFHYLGENIQNLVVF